MNKRTDLAVEAKQLYERSVRTTSALEGVVAREGKRFGFALTHIEITNEKGERTLSKPIGNYYTLELGKEEIKGRSADRAARTLSELLSAMMRLKKDEKVLVVGLGNREVTPDTIGPNTVSGIFLTRHLIAHMPQMFGDLRSVCAVTPGVLGATGFESQELVLGAVGKARPDKVLVIDALASSDPERICTTIQLTDTGIVPGSGVGNARLAFNKHTVGVPVFAIGVPTVMDLQACCDSIRDNSLMVTPRDIDRRVHSVSKIISDGINRTLHPKLDTQLIAELS